MEPAPVAFPAVLWNGFPRVIPVELLDGQPITRARLSANFHISQFLYLRTCLVAARALLGQKRDIEGIPYRGIVVPGKVSPVECRTVSEYGRLASRAIERQFPSFGQGTATLVQNVQNPQFRINVMVAFPFILLLAGRSHGHFSPSSSSSFSSSQGEVISFLF